MRGVIASRRCADLYATSKPNGAGRAAYGGVIPVVAVTRADDNDLRLGLAWRQREVPWRRCAAAQNPAEQSTAIDCFHCFVLLLRRAAAIQRVLLSAENIRNLKLSRPASADRVLRFRQRR